MAKDLRATIVAAMMRLSVPTNLYRVMRETSLPAGTVDYWLDKLVKEGVVVATVTNGSKGYTLQPIFYSPEFSRVFDKELSHLYKLMAKNVVSPETVDKEKCIFATLLSILHVIVSKHRLMNDT